MIEREPPFVTLFCDGCNSGELRIAETEAVSATAARRIAEKHGWTVRSSRAGLPEDFCAFCSKGATIVKQPSLGLSGGR